MNTSILWRRVDLPGHEFCRIRPHGDGWSLSGAAVFGYEGEPCRLEYRVVCDSAWRTLSANVVGEVGPRGVEIKITTLPDGRWQLNGVECIAVKGCVDIDLGFSPSTNLLPIRRLSLGIGESAEVQAAWLPFPSLTLEVLAQKYEREDATTYRYSSRNGSFVRKLAVNQVGFVTSYPGFWEAESAE